MKLLSCFLLLMFLLTACSPKSSPIPVTIPPKVVPAETNTPFSKKITDNPTSSPTNSLEATPTIEVSWPISEIPACNSLKTLTSFPADYSFSGTVLSREHPPYFPQSGPGKFSESGLSRFDGSTKINSAFIKPDDYLEKTIKPVRVSVQDLSVSPDFQKAVYLVDVYTDNYINSDPKKSWLEIYDSSTNDRKRFPWKEEWTHIIGWVNNELFAIRAGGSTLFLDSTGKVKKQYLASKYPDYSNPRAYNPSAYVVWGGYKSLGPYSFDGDSIGYFNSNFRDTTRMNNPTLEIYDPSLQYVIYTEVKDRKPGIVLYDILAQKKVIEIITGQKIEPAAFGGIPVWSPDGKQALMLLPSEPNSGKQDLFLLDVSGKVEKITSFELLGPYSWSPDGKLIAFWLANGVQIGVLNLENKNLQVYCVEGNYYNDSHYFPGSLSAGGELFWLPSGDQILIEISKTADGGNYGGIGLVDLKKSLFIELKWNAEYPAWLEK